MSALLTVRAARRAREDHIDALSDIDDWACPGQPEVARAPWPWRQRRWLFTLAALLVIVPLYVASFVQVPYYLLSPGDARDVAKIITVADGTPVFEPNGQILFTTVSLAPKVNVYDALRGWLDDDIEVVPEEQITGGQPKEEVREYNIALMDNSKLIATKVALEYLGRRVPVEGQGALVQQVFVDSPADGKLEPGDVITAVNGEAVTFHDQAVSLVRQQPAGAVISFAFRRKDKTGTYVDQTTEITAADGGGGVAQVGVGLLTHELSYKFPIDVQIDTGLVSGPSAGLAFTLAIIDELTEGELTGGRAVAVTGEIKADGTVGQVGGVAQKAVTARRHGAEVFLVPPEEVEQATARAGDMEVVGVRTLADAIAALQKLGGTGLALPQAPAPAS